VETREAYSSLNFINFGKKIYLIKKDLTKEPIYKNKITNQIESLIQSI
jgi:hypothetical protein